MFPHQRTPLAEGDTQVHGSSPLTVTLALPDEENAYGSYPFCVLIQDADGAFHLVEGNSPPEMVIE
jgi:hypothetical protein